MPNALKPHIAKTTTHGDRATITRKTPNQIPQAKIKLLGTESDALLARKYGVSLSALRSARDERNIQPAPNSDELSSEITQQLGQIPDCEPAKKSGYLERTISDTRKKLVIPPSGPSAKVGRPKGKTKLPPALISQLGMDSDGELARRFGLPRSTVRYARIARNIELQHTQSGLDDLTIAALGKVRDCDLAKSTGRTESTIRSARTRRGIPAYRLPFNFPGIPEDQLDDFIAALATYDENTLMAWYGAPRSYIQASRALHAPDYRQPPRHPVVPEALMSEFVQALAASGNKALKAQYGVSSRYIRAARAKHSIPRPVQSIKKKAQCLISQHPELSDREIHLQTGVSRYVMRRLRADHNAEQQGTAATAAKPAL
ncbi:hypothetical protein ACI77O_12365 [Pseudomonas tritici]|uniref:hypothetical protein n=1 Tax=Pseudomonas tritici TaxID=2745518 RepID=UPI00387B2164